MKGMMKIVRHYLSLSVGVALLLLLINFIVAICWISSAMQYVGTNYNMKELSSQLSRNEDKFALSPDATTYITEHCAWAMLLDDDGKVIWQMNLPSDIPLSYTASEIAGFSKWYLKDYPVYVWAHSDGLFIVANHKNSTWKMQIEAPQKMMQNMPSWLLIVLFTNFIGAIILSLLLGIRFFRSLRQVVTGIEHLALKKPVCLHIKGVLKDLATNINITSDELLRQQKRIQKRDTARNNWIAGVSHDIRTPLSMIMGYSSSLENESRFSEEDKKQFSVIRIESERIKNLVDDLNLAIRLEYDMQPLNLQPFYLSELLRKVVTDYLNTPCYEAYPIALRISDASQDYRLTSDCKLFERAIRNLIDNSIKHNPQGCEIFVMLDQKAGHYYLEIKDTGCGFNLATLEKLNQTSEMPTGTSHGLGLFIVKQIALASHLQIQYANWEQGSCTTFTFDQDLK